MKMEKFLVKIIKDRVYPNLSDSEFTSQLSIDITREMMISMGIPKEKIDSAESSAKKDGLIEKMKSQEGVQTVINDENGRLADSGFQELSVDIFKQCEEKGFQGSVLVLTKGNESYCSASGKKSHIKRALRNLEESLNSLEEDDSSGVWP